MLPDAQRWARLSPMLDELLDLAEPARGERLLSLCISAPDLSDELQTLLAAALSASSDRFLTGAVGKRGARPQLDDVSLVGQRLGAYVLEAVLGHGGGGSVWRARREDGRFEGSVAVKLLHLSLMGAAGAQRFRREGQILARLAHPHVARLLDAGVTPGGQPYLVLELVAGQPIDQHCDTQRLDITARLALFDDVLAAVAHAHTHGVIHRDLKPGNILVTAEGSVKLLDFGIAKLLADEAGNPAATELTREGGRALTPEYAAPEQVRGEGVTTATDVYALGVLLYQLLTGRHPTAQPGATAAELMQTTLGADVPSLSRALSSCEGPVRGLVGGRMDGPRKPGDAAHAEANATARVAEGVAALRSTTLPRLQRVLMGDLDTIVAHALRKVPSERYPTVAAFAEDLRRLRAHEPVLAQPDSLLYRGGKFVRKHRGAVSAAALLTLSLLTATAVTTWQMIEARQQREEARSQAARSAAAREFLTVMLSEIGADGGAPTPRQMVDRGLYLLNSSQQVDPKFQVSQMVLLGTMYASVGQSDRNRELLTRAEALSRKAGYDEGLIQVLCEQVNTELSAAQREVDRARLAEARQLLARQRPALPQREAGCMVAEADHAEADGRLPDALKLAQQALAKLSANQLQQHALFGSTLSRLSKYNDNLGNARLAHDYNRQSLDALVQRGYGGSIDALVLMSNQTADLQNFGELKLSLAGANKLSEVLDARGTKDTDRVNFLANHGAILSNMGQHEQALLLLDRAIVASLASDNLFWRQRAMAFRARALLRLERFEQARKALDEVQASYQVDPARNKAYLASVALERAELSFRTGDAPGARQQVDSLLPGLGQAGETVTPAMRRALPLAAELALDLPDPKRAIALAQAAVDASSAAALDPTRSAHVGRALWLRARGEQALGQRSQAAASLSSAITSLGHGLGEEHANVASARAQLALWLAAPP